MYVSSEVLLASEHLPHIKYYVIYAVSDKKTQLAVTGVKVFYSFIEVWGRQA